MSSEGTEKLELPEDLTPPKFSFFEYMDFVDESVSEVKQDPRTGFKILEGEFEGLKFIINIIKFDEPENPDENAELDVNFNYDILWGISDVSYTSEDVDQEKMEDVIGKVVMKLIYDMANYANEEDFKMEDEED